MNRLDVELVKRNLVKSRSKAKELILNNFIKINGSINNKPSTMIYDTDSLEIVPNGTLKYVSRGGLKLERAIELFNIDFKDKKVMDIGSSTGGFTDCSLQHGAKEVIAIDVGTNVMDDSLRDDKRIKLYENLNIKDASDDLFNNIDIIVSDVSFISIKYIIDKIVPYKINEVILLIKPQFECGKQIADKYKGVILDKGIHKKIVDNIIYYLSKYNYHLYGIEVSPIRGGSGNIEYISYFKYGVDTPKSFDLDRLINNAFKDVK